MKIDLEKLIANDKNHAEMYEEIENTVYKKAEEKTNKYLYKKAIKSVKNRYGIKDEEQFNPEEYEDEINEEIDQYIRDGEGKEKYCKIYESEFIKELQEELVGNVKLFKEETWEKVCEWIIDNNNSKLPTQKRVQQINREVIKKRFIQQAKYTGIAVASALTGVLVGPALKEQNPGNDVTSYMEKLVENSLNESSEKELKEIFDKEYGEESKEELLYYLKTLVAEAYNAEYDKNIDPNNIKLWHKNWEISVSEKEVENGDKVVQIDEQTYDAGKYKLADIISATIEDGENKDIFYTTRERTIGGIKTDKFVTVFEPYEDVEKYTDNILTENGLAHVLESGINLYDNGFKDNDVEQFIKEIEEYNARLAKDSKIITDENGNISIQYGLTNIENENEYNIPETYEINLDDDTDTVIDTTGIDFKNLDDDSER